MRSRRRTPTNPRSQRPRAGWRCGLSRQGTNARSIATRAAFENAIASFSATGGSTNAVLHLLAIAAEAGVHLEIDDFDAICARTPILADLRPGGRFVATDLFAAGGLGVVMQRLLELGLLHGDAVTVDGRTLARGRGIGNRDARTAGDPPRGRAASRARRDRGAARATSPPRGASSSSRATIATRIADRRASSIRRRRRSPRFATAPSTPVTWS